jgi:hypothetical protein
VASPFERTVPGALPRAGAVPAAAVYTYGWDTAFAIPVPEVNKAIVDHGSSPAGFDVREPTFTVTGDFGPWQICPGGDGRAVRLIWPLANTVLTYTGTGKQYTFAGHAVVEVELHYVPHGDPGPADGRPAALVVNPDAPEPDTPPLSVITLDLTPVPGTVNGALVRAALQAWGAANLAQFAHVFAVVDLNRMVDTGQWGFVAPHYTEYAYLDGDSPEHSLLAVLTMTGTRDGDQLPEQVSAAAIPPGSRAGFLVSQQRTLYDLVRPAMKLAYPGLTDTDFLLNDDGTELYLTDGTSVDLPSVDQNGSTYYPKLTNLTVKSTGQILELTSFTSTEVAAGITATCQSTHWYEVTLGTAADGQTLTFAQSQAPSIVHAIHQSEGSVVTELIISIVAAIALLILIVLTDGAALVVGGLVIGLVLGADQMVPALIEKLNQDDSPSIDLLLVNAVDPITWTGSGAFRLDYASLNASLQLGGDPSFV